MNIVSKLIMLCVLYVAINVTTRPEYISVPIELPKSKSITREFSPSAFPEPLAQPTTLYTEKDIDCLALNIYFEAYEESIKGQLAVGLVTLNRVHSPHFPNTVCGVVYQHKQFSWYWDGKSDLPKFPGKFEAARLLASSLLDPESEIYDYTYGSDHYHADYVDPYWNDGMIKIVQIDTHIFYKDPTISL